ncbi:MAG: ISL3 family transposase [Chloroflexota bacterium]|nr:ISL3 family transposase [Chloroflexota bacterium]
MRLTQLFPHLVGLRLDALTNDDRGIVLTLHATRRTARCPLCRRRSARIHGRYWRSLADRPCAGQRVTLRLQVRRFVCRTATCPRTIFAERFPGLTAAHARRTDAQRTDVTDLGFALGGRPGARLAQRLALPASRSTLLRLVRAAPDPVAPPPRVLGVDDFARRRGQSYGTMLVDMETRRPIDLLPDRTAATLAAWLRHQPQVEIVSRDRAGAYADGIRQGAPDAIQIADRFHLSRNAGEVLERVLTRHHAALRAAAAAVDRAVAVRNAAEPGPPLSVPAAPLAPATGERNKPTRPPTRAEQDRQARHARRHARYDEAMALHKVGVGPATIARKVGVTRQTVWRWLRVGALPVRAPQAPRARMIAPYEPYLRERWQAGCQNARQLWREVRAQGFVGGKECVRRLVVTWRTVPAHPGPPRRHVPAVAQAVPPPPTRPRSPRQARWLLLCTDDQLSPDQQAYRAALLATEPAIVEAQVLTVEFCRLVRERDAAAFTAWLQGAQRSGLPEMREFARVMERDRAAVENALRYAWSNGQTEGQINKLKLLKRSMYGRANFDLLRRRVLHAA